MHLSRLRLISLFAVISLVLPIYAFASQPSVIVTFVNFNPDVVDHNEFYTSTFTGTFPSDTVFDAYFESTVQGQGGYVTGWQRATGLSQSVQNHFVSDQYPYGIYFLRKLYANGELVWTGNVAIQVAQKPFANRIPKGFIDGISDDGIVHGWAYDPNHADSPINVHIYIDGEAGHGGVFAGSATTNIYRPDVNQIEGITGNHGFNSNIPQDYRDGRSHTIYAYAIDSDDSSGASNNRLTGSPMSFTLGSAPNSGPQFSSCSLSQQTIPAGGTAVASYHASDPQNDPFTVTIYWGDGASTTQGNVGTADYKYTSAGIYSVRATATDQRGASSTIQCGTITVLSQQRFIITSVSLSPRQVRQGERYSSTFTANMPIPSDMVFDAVYDSTAPGQGGYVTAWQTGPFKYHYVTNEYPCGTYTLRELLTTDSSGQKYTAWTGAEVVEVIGCQPQNRAPIIASCAPANSIVNVGSLATVNYQISDPDGDYFTVTIEWGDGKTSTGASSSASHVYNSAGTYIVTIFATDTKGQTAIKSCGAIEVRSLMPPPPPPPPPTNRAPIIAFCTPANSNINLGSLATVNYNIYDPDGDQVTVRIEWGDGSSTYGGASSASHIYSAAGTYSVTIFASDSKSATTIKSCGTIIVRSVVPPPANRPPVISSCSPLSQSVQSGSTAIIQYSVSDPDGDYVTITIEWGDGTTSTGALSSASHVYSAAGTYNIVILASDSRGATSVRSCGSVAVTSMQNNPPTISSCDLAASSITIGGTATINYQVSDPDGDSFTVTANWGDGTTSTGGQTSANHAYSSPGTYSVTITATDSRGLSNSRQCSSITVTSSPSGNNSPVISSCNLASSSITVGSTTTINYAVSDPDGDSFTVMVNWGDGTSSPGSSSSASHAYQSAGIFNPSITATDSKTAVASRACGSLAVSSGGTPTQPIGKLQISSVEAKVDGRRDSSLSDNDRISRNAHPESSVEFKVTVKNLFNSTNGLKINDVQVKVTIESIDDGDDMEDEPNEFDLRPQSDKSVTSKFKLPLSIEDGDFDVRIEAEGRDENGVLHTDDIDLTLEVDKESHDLRLLKLNANKLKVSCNEQITLNYQIINLGRDDETKSSVQIRNDELGISYVQEGLEIESDIDNNVLSKSQPIKIANIVEDGDYPLEVSVYSDSGNLEDKKTIQLSVQGCIKPKAEIKTATLANATMQSITTETIQRTLEFPVLEVIFEGTNKWLLFSVFAVFIASIFFVFVAIMIFARPVDQENQPE